MPTSLKEMLAAANAEVPRVPPAEVKALIERGNTLVLDVRDAAELQSGGKIKGAVHVPRGMLEFRADPESPSHNAAIAKDKTVLVYCASGGRSALRGKTLKDLGYAAVFNIGGFKELADAGFDIEPGGRPDLAFSDQRCCFVGGTAPPPHVALAQRTPPATNPRHADR